MSKGVFPLTILLVLLAIGLFTGCSKERDIVPADVPIDGPIDENPNEESDNSSPLEELTYEEYIKNQPPKPAPDEVGCVDDSDCVPAECCHPSSCILAQYSGSCEGIMCTMDCRPGTMDCGQGSCKCIEGGCEAVYKGVYE